MAITRSQTRSGASRLERFNREIGRRQRYRKRYRPNDTSHRHRIADRQPKQQHVVSYYRRT